MEKKVDAIGFRPSVGGVLTDHHASTSLPAFGLCKHIPGRCEMTNNQIDTRSKNGQGPVMRYK